MPVVAVLVGLQASGKTTFCRDVLGERYVQVSKDRFPNARNRQRRQLRLVREALAAGSDVVIDNTNPSPTGWVKARLFPSLQVIVTERRVDSRSGGASPSP